VKTIRKQNLEKLVQRLGSQKAVADAASGPHGSVPESLISQIINGTRNMGEKLARKIEANMGLEQFSLDKPEFNEAPTPKKKEDPRRQALRNMVDLLPDGALDWVAYQVKIAITSPEFKAQERSKKRL
jgi:hypothetical protein